ncbi:MAG: SGNH/GDSL hydrolase family protein [Lachnospiraceae bacterium]|nr:SGNH/GDSL hydrolase family protein [Lachnospiraceae bacterium]
MDTANVKGPVAPKDPTIQRPKIYFMLDDLIATSNAEDGRPKELRFLENRVAGNIKLICPDLPDEIAGRLQKSADFMEIVHSIGVVMDPVREEDRDNPMTVVLQHYGKTDRYNSGTRMEMAVLSDGAERVFPVSDFPCTDEDDILGTLFFFSENEQLQVKGTITFYLNDGFTVPEPVLDPPIDWEGENYQKILERSLMSMGNTTRLRRAIEKASEGEDVTIAFIGGSITQGAGAKPIESKSYAYRIFDYFRNTYAEDPEKVHLVKAGIGGTSSELGVLRYEKDVLRDGTVSPDILIIEFAVNDAGDETNGICFESLCSKAFHRDNGPAVILLFSVFMNDWNLQDRLEPIGRHYDYTMVSVLNGVSPQFPADAEDHVISKRQYFYDIYHPTNDGHRVMADCVNYLIEQSLAHVSDEVSYPEESCLGRYYEKTVTVYPGTLSEYTGIQVDFGDFTDNDKDLQYAEKDLDHNGSYTFDGSWSRALKSKEPFTVTMKCSSFFFIFKDTGDPAFGPCDVVVDGEVKYEYNPLAIGWTHSKAMLAVPYGEPAEHTIQVVPKSPDKRYSIIAFAFTKE